MPPPVEYKYKKDGSIDWGECIILPSKDAEFETRKKRQQRRKDPQYSRELKLPTKKRGNKKKEEDVKKMIIVGMSLALLAVMLIATQPEVLLLLSVY